MGHQLGKHAESINSQMDPVHLLLKHNIEQEMDSEDIKHCCPINPHPTDILFTPNIQ